MKKYMILAGIFFIFSCGEKELDLLPLDRVTSDTFYKTRGDFDSALYASYSSIQDFWGISAETLGENGEYWKISVVITDDAAADTEVSDGVSQDIDLLQIRASDVPYGAVYSQIYEGIYRANIVLTNLGNENELTEADKTILEAEAKFLRGWFHFQALKLFGTPPLALEVKTDLTDLALPNATQDELYASILDDFAVAAAGLPEDWGSADRGRATAWAAKSYIGKVNVWKKDWPAAITAFEDVVLNGPYMLMPDYADNFNYDTENNMESIFEIQFGGPFSDDNIWVFDDTHSENFKASQGSTRSYHWGAANGAPGGKRGWFIPSQDLIDAFEPGDVRADETYYETGDMYYVWSNQMTQELPYDPEWSSDGLSGKKYLGAHNAVGANRSPNGAADFNNERWFRFAELKLLYAEALIEGGGDQAIAKQQIDDIRVRAGLPILAADRDLTEAMRQEKRMELAFEPHRWFDITRWGIGSELFGTAWSENYNVFPFPLTEIDRSDGLLKQNPGY